MEKFIVVLKTTGVFFYYSGSGKQVMMIDSTEGSVGFVSLDAYIQVFGDNEKTAITKRKLVAEYHQALVTQLNFISLEHGI